MAEHQLPKLKTAVFDHQLLFGHFTRHYEHLT
jgi:hypothetical protein